MSFSSNVKEELSHRFGKARHCLLAEVTAILNMCGQITVKDGFFCVKIQTENLMTARKFFTLIQKTFNIDCEVSARKHGRKNRTYLIVIREKDAARKVLLATGSSYEHQGKCLPDPLLLQKRCCKRAYLRGIFLAVGSLCNPEKTYHLELVQNDREYGAFLCQVLKDFGMDAKMVKRKHSYIIYLKDGEYIVNLLNIMEAHISLMQLENVRIVKDMRNNVNRMVNCETANLSKTVEASVKQMQDIQYIETKRGLSFLPEMLQEMAAVRLQYPDASLKELGMRMNPPVGKSGVNHRLRKLGEIAEILKIEEEGGEVDAKNNYHS